MVIPTPDTKPLEIHGADGQVIGYVVSAEQMNRLRVEIASLREQLDIAERQRDHHLAKRQELLRTHFPLPPTEEELLTAPPNSHEVMKLIADLESR
jgi:hypothetical protein